jgi:prepilin-type N-terminal cleavage/methylation domain-containing protein
MNTERTARTHGFTLIELMIVVAIIAIIAAVAIPNLLSSRLSANESSAVATLRTVSSAQAQAQTGAYVDTDSDGMGEFLYLGELSGVTNLRGLPIPMDPAAVSVSMGLVSNSAVTKAGYHFAMYLPDAAGAGVAEDPNGGKAAPGAVDADLSEMFWACYAWPANVNTSGNRAFVVNQAGTIMQSTNILQGYSGVGAGGVIPAADAAYTAAGDMTSALATGSAGPAQDAGVWIPVN